MQQENAETAYFDQGQEAEMLTEEWAQVAAMRGYPPGDNDRRDNLVGLALSGGGIRSASFALGVLQGLVSQDVFKRIDYLSTVSGGGYIGTALTWFLHKGWTLDPSHTTDPPPPIDATNFPIGQIYGSGRRKIDQTLAAGILSFIRQHGNYLNPSRNINVVSGIAVVVRTVFLALLVYFSLLLLSLVVLGILGGQLRPLIFFEFLRDWVGPAPANAPYFDVGGLYFITEILVCAFVVTCASYSLVTFVGAAHLRHGYEARVKVQAFMGWLLAGIIASAMIGSLPIVARFVDGRLDQLWTTGALAAVSTLLGGLAAVFDFLKGSAKGEKAKRPGPGLLIWVAGGLLIYGILMLVYSLSVTLMEAGHELLVLAIILVGTTLGLLVNLNHFSLHRMYRDRLMETFLPDRWAVENNRWGLAKEADKLSLDALCTGSLPGPYHIINANVLMIDARHARFRGRGGDSFVLSPFVCGSAATGWRRTSSYMKGWFNRGMTLPTAMAISGAALNPGAGVGGKGVTRNRIISLILTIMNIRLGYWATNPDRARGTPMPANYLFPGLLGLRGKGFNERASFVELTDGGHFENIGLYELIRRKMKVIIVSDGTADPDFTFSDFGNAVERVRVDFDVMIRFWRDTRDLRGILPGSVPPDDGADDAAFRDMYKMAERGFAIGEIAYPPEDGESEGTRGTLIYIKSTLIKDLPADIYGYKSAHPTFPDQPTSDQFFDESQFEAYRELGYRLCAQVPFGQVFPDGS